MKFPQINVQQLIFFITWQGREFQHCLRKTLRHQTGGDPTDKSLGNAVRRETDQVAVLLFGSLRPFLKSNSRLQCPDVQAPPFPPLASASVTHPPLGLPPLVCGCHPWSYSLLTQAFFQATGTRRKQVLKTVLALRLRRTAPSVPRHRCGAPAVEKAGRNRVTPTMLRLRKGSACRPIGSLF